MQVLSKLKARNPACLIPSHKKTERRLLSVLMAAMDIVPAFRDNILSEAGYGSGKTCQYQSYMEPEFDVLNSPPGRPDGVIFCERGKTNWSAFIEAKSDSNNIDSDQIARYAELAAFLDIDAVISISNEHALTSTDLPYNIQAKKLKKRKVIHFSWSEVVIQIELMLGAQSALNTTEELLMREVLAYMTTSGNGVLTFDQMPESWNNFVTQANAPHGLNKNTQGVNEVIHAWQQERRDLKLKLLRKHGSDVDLWFDRASSNDPKVRNKNDIERLVNNYELGACYTFKNSKVDMYVTSDLKACLSRVVAVIRTPKNKKAKGVVTWLLNSLSDCQYEQLGIHLDWPRTKDDIFTTLGELRLHPEIGTQTLKDAPTEVRLTLAIQSVRSFKSRKKFISELETTTLGMSDLLKDASLV